VLTHRPEFANRWASHSHVTGLSKLTKPQSVALVHKISGKPLPAELIERIIAKTDGVPLFAEELTKSVLESGQLKDTGDRYEYQGDPATLTLPATLRDSLMARLDKHQAMKEVAQIGAAIGREFTYELVSAVAPLTATQLDSALARLTDSGLVFRRGTPPEASYFFKHALVQDAAYDTLLKSLRQELHAKIAGVIETSFSNIKETEPEVLAHHFEQGGLQERAVAYWTIAGQRALARVSLPEAVAHLRAGLGANARLPSSAERNRKELELRVLLGTACQSLFGWTAMEVIETLEPARQLAIEAGDDERYLQILDIFQAHHLTRAEFSKAVEINSAIEQLARARNDSGAYILALVDDGLTKNVMGNFTGAQRAFESALESYNPEEHRRLVHTHYNFDMKCVALATAGH
jgi:predicted ATPase